MAKRSQSLTSLALQKFKKNFWGVLSFWYIVLVGLVAIFAYAIAPDDTSNANQMHLSIHSKKPGFEVMMLKIPEYVFYNNIIQVEEYAADGLEGIKKSISFSEFKGATTSQDIEEEYIEKKRFLLGTDKYGRDLLSRMFIGARISFFIGFIAVFISLIIGITMGSLAGYFGGKIDTAIMFIINVAWSIPTLLLVIAITLAIGKGFWQVFIAVGLTMWVEVARVVRGQIMSAKQLQYVTAARALGYTDFRIISKHILPNVMAPVIVIAAANFAGAILIESGLSFLGIGAQPPTPSWGGMIKDHYNYIILGKPYLAIIPGLAIMSLVMAFMLIGNALRDALDVKT